MSDPPRPEPARRRTRPLPIGLALAFFLVPAIAFLYANRDVWLPAPAPPSPPERAPAVALPAPSPREGAPDAATRAKVDEVLLEIERKRREKESAPTEAPPPPESADAALLASADRFLDEGERLLRPGSGHRPSHEMTRAALAVFEKARDAYREYASLHPERERSVAPRLRQVNAHILWCRKELPVEPDGPR
jgi:hypothetical protein